VARIARLVTFVDIREAHLSQLSFSARHDALLADGRWIVLLDDRGWTQSRIRSFSTDGSRMPEAPSSPWDRVRREDIEETARMVVGPDSAYGGYTQAEMDEGHWSFLSAALEEHGVVVDAANLRALPHEVELSDRLVARLEPSGEPGSVRQRDGGSG
jgi:hypothetical protein